MMKFFWPTAFLLAVLGVAQAGWKIESKTTMAELPNGARLVEVAAASDTSGAKGYAFVFDERQYRLAVVDNADKSTTLSSALQNTSAVAGVNGGYFHEDFSPVGLLVANGQTIRKFQTAKLLSGVLWVSKAGKSGIMDSAEFSGRNLQPQQAMQAGPNLMRQSRPVAGLNATRAARRTVVATDGKGKWALIVLSSASLADTAEILALPNLIDGLKITQALNLDGGSSTGMWVRMEPRPFSMVPFTLVRNYLGVFPK